MASADVDPSIFLSFSRKGRWIASSCQCVIAETLTQKEDIFASFRPVSAITSMVEMLQQSPYNKLTEIP